MKTLQVLHRAAEDLAESAFFYAIECGPALEERFRTSVRETVEWLCENPEAGARRSFRNPRLAGLRRWPIRGFKKHLVFYRIVAGGIEVVRVLHGVRDLETILEEA